MPKPRTSVIWLIPREDLQNIIDASSSIVEVLQKLGFDGYNGNHRTLTRRLKDDHFNLEIMKSNYKINLKRNKINDQQLLADLFTKDSKKSRSCVKKYIIRSNLIPYKCRDCGNAGTHNERPLSLQLEHVNGLNNDNRLENLCFLCPNCHAQTKTFSGKNAKKQNKKALETDLEKQIRIAKMRKFEASAEELQTLIAQYSMRELGEMFGVSDNAIRKRCYRLKVDVTKAKNYQFKQIGAVDGT